MQNESKPGALRQFAGFTALFFGGMSIGALCLGIAAVLGGRDSLFRVLINYLPITVGLLFVGIALYDWRKWRFLLSVVCLIVGSGLLLLTFKLFKSTPQEAGINDESKLNVLRYGTLKTGIPVFLIGISLLIMDRVRKLSQKK
jgi:hypothetical protein